MTTETTGAVSVPTKLRSISVLAPELVSKLAEQGILDSSTLLERGAMPEERDALAAATGLDPIQLLRAIYLIDLERVDGVAWSSAALLTAAGVTTVPDLAFRSAEDLLPQLQRANAEQALVKRLPSLKAIKGWIDHARGLPQVVFFGGNGEVY
jgi:predicted flap endonuclease-1-like 5' DNA nuclease